MNVQQKIAYAKRSIQSITEHDDAPTEEVAAAVDELQKFAGDEFKKALKRRAGSSKAGKKAAAIKG